MNSLGTANRKCGGVRIGYAGQILESQEDSEMAVSGLRQKPTNYKLARLIKADVSYDDEAKDLLHREAAKVLKGLAEALGLEKGEYEIRKNPAGPAVSGEITLHAEHWYVQVSQGSVNDVMWRLCNGQKDYVGMANQWARAEELEDVQAFAARLRKALSSPYTRHQGPGSKGGFQISEEAMMRFGIVEA